MATAAPRVLMCRPTHFRIAYEINPWMHVRRPANPRRARAQWAQLHRTLLRLGARVQLIPPVAAQPDLVFTANAGLVHGHAVVLSNFRHPERQGEAPLLARWFRKHGYRVRQLPKTLRFEGEGDALWLGCRLIMGYRFRSDVRAQDYLSRWLRCEVVSLELRAPYFYHLDTCFCPLDDETALYYPGAFDRYGQRVLARLVPDAIRVSRAEAHHFVCNAIPIGDALVVPRGLSRTTAKALAARGWHVIELELSEFMKAGGAAKCLVLRL